MLATPDQQISLTDPDARSMATSGRGSGVVGYNVQMDVDTKHHLIVTHEVTNVGNDRSQLAGASTARRSWRARRRALRSRLPKPMTSNAKADGRFGKQDFRYVADEDVYICPAGERLTYRYMNEENGLVLRRYWTNVCQSCAIKHSCTPASSDGSRAGSMSMFSKPSSAGSTSTRKKCANGARRSSIRSGRSRRGWEQRTS
jgi:hypothetical protein